MKTKAITAALVVTLVAGCAAQPQGPRTLVDTYAPGFSYEQYRTDMDQCNGFAAQRPVGTSAANGAMGGLVVGALFGALVGSAYGDTGYGAAYGAALGTTSGAVQGAASGVATQQSIVRECMRGRGYRVLER